MTVAEGGKGKNAITLQLKVGTIHEKVLGHTHFHMPRVGIFEVVLAAILLKPSQLHRCSW
jgi:hypothetical protein